MWLCAERNALKLNTSTRRIDVRGNLLSYPHLHLRVAEYSLGIKPAKVGEIYGQVSGQCALNANWEERFADGFQTGAHVAGGDGWRVHRAHHQRAYRLVHGAL